MPLYVFECCNGEMEVIQGIDKDTPLCPDCGAKMRKLPTYPAIIRINMDGGVRVHSKGYKEGYAKEYQRRLQENKS